MQRFALIDLSTVVYQVYFSQCRYYKPEIHKEETLIPFLKTRILSLVKPSLAPGYSPVYLLDTKKDGKYWRQNFIEDNKQFYSDLWADPKTGSGLNPSNVVNDEKYKGGRLKATAYNAILKFTWLAARQIMAESIYFEEPSLEADDFAGLFVKYKPKDCYLDLVTVDRDWAGLLRNNDKTIRFIDLYPKRKYSIEYAEDAVNYFKKKLHSAIESPEEAYYWKQKLGEKSDNLLAGCHIELIDLINHCAPISYGFESTHQKVKTFLGLNSVS